MKDTMIYNILDSISQKSCIDEKDIKTLIGLLKTNNSEIKSYIAELLVMASGEDAEIALINLCKDEDELVRVNACDSLSVFSTSASYEQLLKSALNDPSILVRTYAVLSLADIAGTPLIDIGKLKKTLIKLSKEKYLSLSSACFRGLYILGDKIYLENLLALFKLGNYREKCMIVNMLYDILDDDNRSFIISRLLEFRNGETSNAVISNINNLLSSHIY